MKNPEHFSLKIILPVALLTILVVSPVAYSSQPTSIWSRSHLFGDWAGVRPWLARQGVDIGAVEQPVPSDVMSGGARQGKAFAGLLTLSARIHLSRYVDVPGLSAYISAWVPQGHGPTAYYVHSLSGLSYEEAPDGARLADAYLAWHAPHDTVHVKIGKFGIDENFDQNPIAAVLVNSNFTYRNIMANNLPGGGPAFSYEGPGVMVAVQTTQALRLRGGLFSGDPLGQPLEGPPPQVRDSNGLIFPLNTGALVIGEADYTYHVAGLGQGTFLVGGLYDTLSRPDLFYNEAGESLALGGSPRQDRGDYVLYAGDTQTVWRGAAHQRLQMFTRIAYAPPDRNLISFDAQAGIVFNGMFCDRPHDALAFAISYDRISSQSINLIQDQNVLNSSNAPLPSAETDFELDYTAYITPWLTMTPDLQYILHPGGGIPDAQNPAEFDPNAVVGQMELTIVF